MTIRNEKGGPVYATLAAAVLGLSVLAGAAAAQEREVGAEERTALSLTVYNRDLALVGETRRVQFQEGENVLALVDVSRALKPETLLLEGEGLAVLEQGLEFDLLTPGRILEKSVGETVWLVRTHPQTGEDSFVEAEVLAVGGGVVLRVGDRIETAPPGRLAFRELPDGLRRRPTLLALIASPDESTRDLEIRYLTGGLTWQADYLAEYDPEAGRLDLAGLITLTNASGLDYPDARLRLVAGEVNVAGGPEVMRQVTTMMAEAAMAPTSEPQARPLGEQHLYEVGRPVSLADRETKQVVLLKADAIAVGKEFRFERLVAVQGGPEEIGPLQADVVLSFENAEAGPDRPLPGGVVRVYQGAGEGEVPVFVGEDRIGHTPKGEEVRLAIGSAFDVTGRARRTALERLSNKTYESAQEIIVSNAKDEAVTALMIGHMPPGWRMVQESAAHEAETANRIVWKLPVPAGGEARLTYRVRVTRP
jgi:hypothetical protein